MKKYEKPALKFVMLRNEEAMANTCRSCHGSDTELYCDIPGGGYVSFQVADGDSGLNLINVIYYDGNGSGSPATDAHIAILKQMLADAGCNVGQP